jgi:hypothetical protein
MEFPPSWTINPAKQFEVTTAPDSGPLTLQLLAQVRPTGRILDNFQVALGGTQIVCADVDLGQLILASTFNRWRLRFQYWPRDINIRRNMVTSGWTDVAAMVSSNDAAVFNESDVELSTAAFRAGLEDTADHEPDAASLRWAVVIGSNKLLKLQLQGLPAAASLLSGKHHFKG